MVTKKSKFDYGGLISSLGLIDNGETRTNFMLNSKGRRIIEDVVIWNVHGDLASG